MEAIFEIIFQLLGEFLLQFLFEALAEIGIDWLADREKKPKGRIVSILGFLFLGTVSGFISLLIAPHSMISSLSLRMVNLVGTPVLASACMLIIGNWRAARGREPVKLNRFSYAFCFAFSMAMVRFLYAR